MRDLPKIISVDDHVLEPATVWTDRLPSKYHHIGPRIMRAPVKTLEFIGGKFTAVPGDPGDPGERQQEREVHVRARVDLLLAAHPGDETVEQIGRAHV